MNEVEAMKQEILDALDYKTPAGSYRLRVGSMQKVSLCRVYGIRYGDGHLKATIPNGTDEQTIKAHEIVANVIEYGVRKHPEHVNGRTCRELYEENRQLKADLVNWERELNAADAKLKALEDERNLASKQIAGFRFENARLVAINENLENQLKAAEAWKADSKRLSWCIERRVSFIELGDTKWLGYTDWDEHPCEVEVIGSYRDAIDTLIAQEGGDNE